MASNHKKRSWKYRFAGVSSPAVDVVSGTTTSWDRERACSYRTVEERGKRQENSLGLREGSKWFIVETFGGRERCLLF